MSAKTTTTVAMDFGRISFPSELVLYLFGTPGQERFWFMWDELAVGALGAVVLADTRRVADCFASIDYFERNGTPFVIAVNCFDDAPRFQPEDIRIALSLGPEVPVVLCDARQRDSVKQVLVSLVKYVMTNSSPLDSGDAYYRGRRQEPATAPAKNRATWAAIALIPAIGEPFSSCFHADLPV